MLNSPMYNPNQGSTPKSSYCSNKDIYNNSDVDKSVIASRIYHFIIERQELEVNIRVGEESKKKLDAIEMKLKNAMRDYLGKE